MAHFKKKTNSKHLCQSGQIWSHFRTRQMSRLSFLSLGSFTVRQCIRHTQSTSHSVTVRHTVDGEEGCRSKFASKENLNDKERSSQNCYLPCQWKATKVSSCLFKSLRNVQSPLRSNYYYFQKIRHQTCRQQGGTTGLVVMGGDSRSEGRGFKSQHCKLDGYCFTFICCKHL